MKEDNECSLTHSYYPWMSRGCKRKCGLCKDEYGKCTVYIKTKGYWKE